jgi:3-oxoadipate enol-lactonase
LAICRTGEYPIYFEEAGRGLPVILIHGHAVDLRVWDEVVPYLVAGGNRVIRYDVRGHGQSFAPDEGYTWAAYVGDLQALMANVGVQEVVVVGFSMGGGIALAYAEAHPERMAGLALVCPALPGFGYSEEFSDPIALMQEHIKANGVHPTIETEFRASPLFDVIRDDADAMDKLHSMMAGYSGKEYLAPPTEQPDEIIPGLANIAAPTIVFTGTREVPDMRQIARLIVDNVPCAELKEYDGGHMVPMERPTEFAADLNAFIAAKVVSTLKR